MDTLVITRVAERQWHALDDDLVVGRGDASPRPDGRLFLSIDAWHDDVFASLAEAMLAEILAATHARGVETVAADVHEANTAAIALFETAGARRTGSNLELVIH
ncbi:hypothetical protein ABT297_03105 [Dactylosporangium sp. NPDC000555]|uniref:hypothetical protein n=1 Tax=Dactylosporangium sp. NPDC000555 TaxID=3154260 RepID=UPI00331706A8